MQVRCGWNGAVLAWDDDVGTWTWHEADHQPRGSTRRRYRVRRRIWQRSSRARRVQHSCSSIHIAEGAFTETWCSHLPRPACLRQIARYPAAWLFAMSALSRPDVGEGCRAEAANRVPSKGLAGNARYLLRPPGIACSPGSWNGLEALGCHRHIHLRHRHGGSSPGWEHAALASDNIRASISHSSRYRYRRYSAVRRFKMCDRGCATVYIARRGTLCNTSAAPPCPPGTSLRRSSCEQVGNAHCSVESHRMARRSPALFCSRLNL
ncbi:hypothetical protein F4780DRAFT_293255 [Xylariomycetidae sp. FL0641]|nr:hypothetical protein F4780DRAFT_293255 [Xylariomycetidae sp. FL0641]